MLTELFTTCCSNSNSTSQLAQSLRRSSSVLCWCFHWFFKDLICCSCLITVRPGKLTCDFSWVHFGEMRWEKQMWSVACKVRVKILTTVGWTNLEKKESGIHIRVCLEVLKLQSGDTIAHFLQTRFIYLLGNRLIMCWWGLTFKNSHKVNVHCETE